MIYVLCKIKKNITFFHLKITIFTAVKYCCILHGHVCVMAVCNSLMKCDKWVQRHFDSFSILIRWASMMLKWKLNKFYAFLVCPYIEIVKYSTIISLSFQTDRSGKTVRYTNHWRWLEAWNFAFRRKRYCTIQVPKTKALISFAVTVKLTCIFVFAYAKRFFLMTWLVFKVWLQPIIETSLYKSYPSLHLTYSNKNSADVDIAPAFGKITTACNVGQAKNGSWCVLDECVKDNHYERFHTHSHCCCREMHFISRLDIKFGQQSVEREM